MFCRFGLVDDSRPVAAMVLIERGVNAPGFRVDRERQRVDVRGFELGQRSVLKDQGDDRVGIAEPFEFIGVNRETGLRPPARREFQFDEQQLAELLGGADIDGPPGSRLDIRLQLGQP